MANVTFRNALQSDAYLHMRIGAVNVNPDDRGTNNDTLRPGEQVDVPAGALRVGTQPGLRARGPLCEADLVALQVPAFRMDRLPYPNGPAQPPRTQVTRPQAEALCAERQ